MLAFKSWLWKKIFEEFQAETLYEKLSDVSKLPQDVPQGLKTELLAVEGLQKQFKEHGDDEKKHRGILAKIYKELKLDKDQDKLSVVVQVHNTLQDVLLSIIYDEASAAVEYIEGIHEYWIYLGENIETRAIMLGIVVDELDHLSDTVAHLKLLNKEFQPDRAHEWMTSSEIFNEKRKKWQSDRIWEKAAAAFLTLYALSQSEKNSLSDDSKKKLDEMYKDMSSPFYLMRSFDIALGRSHGAPYEKGRGMFIVHPYEKDTRDVLRYGDITSLYFRDSDNTESALKDFIGKISMEPSKKTTIGIAFQTRDKLVEVGPFGSWPTFVKEEDADKIPKNTENDIETSLPDPQYPVKTIALHEIVIAESMKPSDYNRDIYAICDTRGGVHFATQESLPGTLIDIRTKVMEIIEISKVNNIFWIDV